MEKHLVAEENKPKSMGKATGHSTSSIQRILNQETGITLEILTNLAEAFNLSPYQFLIPNLDVENPQIVVGARISEQRIIRDFYNRPLPTSKH